MLLRLKWIGLVLFLFLLLMEVLLSWVIGLNQRPLYQLDETIEYTLKANQQLTRFGNRYTVNEYHMRSEYFPNDYFNTDKLRIMVYGDSIINGGTKLDQSEITTSILQRKLIGKNVKAYVGNISAGSWGPENILEYVKKYGSYQADIAFIVLSSHDAFDVPSFTELGSQSHPVKHHYSSLYELFLKYIARGSRKQPSNKVFREKKLIKDHNENKKLTQLVLLLKQQVKKVYIIQHYTKDELAKNTAPVGHSIINRTCEITTIQCIDSKPLYLSLSELNDLYLDGLHLSQSGHLMLSSIIFKQIEVDSEQFNPTKTK